MPKCCYCKKVFKDRQALGSHIKTHLDDSDEDSNRSIQEISQNLIEASTQILNDQTLEKTKVSCKRVRVEQDSNDFQRRYGLNINKSIEKQDQNQNQEQDRDQEQDQDQDQDGLDFTSGYESDSKSSGSSNSDEESVTSDLSYITDVNADEYTEYDALFTGIPSNPDDMYQEFPSEEFAEFMQITTKFRVQDPLADAFIRFFNKYSNRDDNPLPSTSRVGREFIENLQLPNFKWRKKKILEYKGKEYIFEHRTVLDGIHQILMNKSITEDFIFEYKSSTDDVSIIY